MVWAQCFVSFCLIIFYSSKQADCITEVRGVSGTLRLSSRWKGNDVEMTGSWVGPELNGPSVTNSNRQLLRKLCLSVLVGSVGVFANVTLQHYSLFSSKGV